MLNLRDSKVELTEEIKESIKDYLQDDIESNEEIFQEDIEQAINDLYNTDYYIIGTYRAKEFLAKHFDLLLETLKNYKDSFGEQYHDITNPEKLASLIMIDLSQSMIDDLLEELNE